MTERSLQILDNDPDGFYLFVEHEGIDEASHGNDAKELVLSVAEFSSAVQVAVNWVNSPSTPADWSNTLFVVVGDHETGGITNVVNYGAGVVPGITFTTSGHTTTPVRVFAQGAGAEQIAGQIDNTHIFAILSPAAGAALAAPANLAATPVSQSQIDLAWTDQSDNEETFEVERSADGITGWTLIGTSAANAATFSDLGIPENTLFFYRVRAVNGSGSSAHSNVASARSFATPSIMHIGDIDGTRSAVKKNWSATVTITVHDAAEKPVSGVLVAGAWSGGATGNVSCTTTTAGTCQVTKGNVKPNAPSVTFTVTSFAKAGSTFEPASNHDDDRDSNGMAITVSR